MGSARADDTIKGVVSVDETPPSVHVDLADSAEEEPLTPKGAVKGGFTCRTAAITVAVLSVVAVAIGLGVGLGMDWSSDTSQPQTITTSGSGSWSVELTINAPSFDDTAVSAFNTQLALTLALPEARIDTMATAAGRRSSFRLIANVTGLNGAQIIQATRRYAGATDSLSDTVAASQHLGVQVIELLEPVGQWPSNEKRYPLYWDGKNPIDMPRSLLATGNVIEMVYSFSPEEMAKAGLIINGTHAIFPLPENHEKPLVRAGVTQKYNTPGMERTRSGVAMLQSLQTPISMFPNTLGGFAEKIAVTSHSGHWGSKGTADWEAKLTIPPTKITDLNPNKTLFSQPQGQQWLKRSKTLFEVMSRSRFGVSLLESLADPLQLGVLQGMQKAKMAPDFVLSSQELSSEAARWSHGAGGTVPEGHMTNCIHFTNAEGVIPLPHAMAFPLDTPILTYKGQTEIPSHTISMMAGMGAFYYNAVTRTLEIRMAFSLEGVVRDPSYTRPEDTITQAIYAQGPPNGVAFPSSQQESDGSIKDSRNVAKSIPNEDAHRAYKELITQTKIDFGMMYLDLSPWCAGEHVYETTLADFQTFWLFLHNQSQTNPTWSQPHTSIGSQLEKRTSAFAQLNFNSYVGTAITTTMPCGNVFERSPTGQKNFAGLLEITTWAHFMLEQSAISPNVIFYAASRQGWDDVQ